MTSPAPQPTQTAGSYAWAALSMIGDLSIALLFLVTWLEPDHVLARPLATMMLVMLLEFIIIHSSAFMGQAWISSDSPRRKALSIIGFGGFYTLFVGGFALGFGVLWPLAAFWLLTANRLLSLLFDPNPSQETKQALQERWGGAVATYVGFAFLTLLPMPKLGITAEVVAAAGIPGSGAWVSSPHKVIAFGFLYFSMSAYLEGRRRLRASSPTRPG